MIFSMFGNYATVEVNERDMCKVFQWVGISFKFSFSLMARLQSLSIVVEGMFNSRRTRCKAGYGFMAGLSTNHYSYDRQASDGWKSGKRKLLRHLGRSGEEAKNTFWILLKFQAAIGTFWQSAFYLQQDVRMSSARKITS